jgi:hypothetical protein
MMSAPKLCLPGNDLNVTQDSIQVIAPSTQVVNAPSKKEEALIEALQASTSANEALEAVIKLQARAIEQMMEENRKLVQQAHEAHRTKHAKSTTCDAFTEVAPFSSLISTETQTGGEAADVSTVEAAVDVPQSSPRIQPPAVPPTPRKMSKSHDSKGNPIVAPPSQERVDMEKLSQANASPFVAEAFRLGWLAGVKSNSMAANKSPSSTRSDDSQPSDPGSAGSYIVGSRGSESGDSRGSLSPPGPNDKLPALPTLMPPPPPPVLLAAPEIPFEQLAQRG